MIEFDCVECGQHIVRFNHEPGELLICGHCMHIPGWFRHPYLRQALGSDEMDLPDNEKDVANDDAEDDH